MYNTYTAFPYANLGFEREFEHFRESSYILFVCLSFMSFLRIAFRVLGGVVWERIL